MSRRNVGIDVETVVIEEEDKRGTGGHVWPL
jgi:hypothetical protein